MDDKFEDLDIVFKNKIEEIKKYNYEQLVEECKKENLDYSDLSENDLKVALIAYYSEEIEDWLEVVMWQTNKI